MGFAGDKKPLICAINSSMPPVRLTQVRCSQGPRQQRWESSLRKTTTDACGTESESGRFSSKTTVLRRSVDQIACRSASLDVPPRAMCGIKRAPNHQWHHRRSGSGTESESESESEITANHRCNFITSKPTNSSKISNLKSRDKCQKIQNPNLATKDKANRDHSPTLSPARQRRHANRFEARFRPRDETTGNSQFSSKATVLRRGVDQISPACLTSKCDATIDSSHVDL